MAPRHNLAVLMPRTDDLVSLIGRTAEGDESALGLLYDATSAQVYGLALRIVGDGGMAEEVAADVFLQVWRQAVRFDPDRGAPLGWLLTMARSRAIDRLRASGRRHAAQAVQAAREVAPSHHETPEEHAGAAERRQVVQHALMRLSPHERRAIELAYFDGLSHTEIASVLETPLGTVKTRIRTGMTRLRQTLGKHARTLL